MEFEVLQSRSLRKLDFNLEKNMYLTFTIHVSLQGHRLRHFSFCCWWTVCQPANVQSVCLEPSLPEVISTVQPGPSTQYKKMTNNPLSDLEQSAYTFISKFSSEMFQYNMTDFIVNINYYELFST